MRVNAAIALIMAGLGLELRRGQSLSKGSWRRHLGTACAVVAVLIGGLTVFEYASGFDLHIDQLMLRDSSSPAESLYPGRMGLNTALSVALEGLAILLLDWAFGNSTLHIADGFAIGAGAIAMLAVFGYAYSVRSLLGVGSYTQMALPSSISLSVLSIGLLNARPHRGLMALVVDEGVGSVLARRLLPATVIIPFVIGWVQLEGQHAGLYGTEMGVAFLMATMIALFGALIYTTAVSLNRTDRQRQQAEESVRTEKERLEFALENAHVGIWDMDYTTGVFRWSKILEAQYGLQPGTFEGTFQAFVERIHPDDRASVLETVVNAVKTGEDFSAQSRTILPDGTVRWLNGVGRVRLTEQGEPARAVGISLDVTERRALEAQFHQAQKMEAVGRLAGGVAHDFNNLLTAILGYCELLMADLMPDDPHQADLAQIQKAGQSAATLTRQLLAFSRKQIIEPTLLDLNAVVTSMLAMLGRLIGEDVKVVLAVRADLPTIKADSGHLEQVVLNLGVNARDAMPKGGTLTIETANVELDEHYATTHLDVKPGSYVALTVTDTGDGMTPAVQARMSEPFFTTKPAGKGTGLGLAMVHGIAKQSGGSISVHSEVGKGTSVTVYFPRVEAVERAGPAAPPMSPRAVRGTVLIVEDAEGLCMLAQKLLARQGYSVLAAVNGDEALRLFEDNPSIDVLLTDVVMPGASGPELSREMVRRRPTLKVIYMSGYTEDAIAQHEVATSGIALLNKPFTAEALGRAIRDVLERS